jgi:tripartite ATP-independent transporter DctM subunit
MGGLSGSSIADAAMQSKMLVPEMVNLGYDKTWSAVVTGASAMITPIIPPGIAMIIYGYTANLSIGRIFLGGFGPGVLCCILMMILTHFIAKKKNYKPIRTEKAPFGEILKASANAWLALLMLIVIIGGVRFGVFTATETGAIAVGYALFLGFIVYREMTLRDFFKAIRETTVTTATIMMIMTSASVVAWLLTIERVPQTVTTFIMTYVHSPYAFLILVNFFLLIVGMFIEANAAMLVLIPILQPSVRMFGIDEYHFALVFVFNMAIGSITPPMGALMFTTCVATQVKIADFVRECIPYYVMLIICLAVITFFPQVTLFLPNLFWK